MDLFSAKKPYVVVVGCKRADYSFVSDLLKDTCKVRSLHQDDYLLLIGDSAQLADLILLEGDLPDSASHTICLRLTSDPVTRKIPVVFLSNRYNSEYEKLGFACGAIDYMARPIHPDVFMARVKSHLEKSSTADILRTINTQLEQEITQRTQEVTLIQDVTILAMTSLARTRDSETGNHIQRTKNYVYALSRKLQTHPRFSNFLTHHNIDILFKSAPLHDIGKVGIPDHILRKPGGFDPAEMIIMKTHTTLGRDAIEQAEYLLGARLEFFTIAKEIAYAHHEKWDGSGYPLGLTGEAIPISARLMALADVYDALISRRIYKEALPHEEAVQIIKAGKGKHFDPDIVEAFLSLADDFNAIAKRFSESATNMEMNLDYLAIAGRE